MKRVMLIHGPNLNMLGIRNKKMYGTCSLQDVNNSIKKKAYALSLAVDIFQFNGEGEIVAQIHKAYHGYNALIINAGAYSHYSVAIRDAIEAIAIPTIEVHISNIYARESFRAFSMISPVCTGQITGLGIDGYILALEKISYLI